MVVFNPKYADLITRILDDGLLKNVFLTRESQIPQTFPKKLKTVLTRLFKTEAHTDLSHEIIPPLFKPDGSMIPAYHYMYTQHNQHPLVPQQQPVWEMIIIKVMVAYFSRF